VGERLWIPRHRMRWNGDDPSVPCSRIPTGRLSEDTPVGIHFCGLDGMNDQVNLSSHRRPGLLILFFQPQTEDILEREPIHFPVPAR